MNHLIYHVIFNLCISTTVLFAMEKSRETNKKQPVTIIVTSPEGISHALSTAIIREAMAIAAKILKLQNFDVIQEEIKNFEKKYKEHSKIYEIQAILTQLHAHLQQKIKS